MPFFSLFLNKCFKPKGKAGGEEDGPEHTYEEFVNVHFDARYAAPALASMDHAPAEIRTLMAELHTPVSKQHRSGDGGHAA